MCPNLYIKLNKQCCTKSTNSNIKQFTVQNEQSTMSACIKQLYKNDETHIGGFGIKTLPRVRTH
jgi:hypothetical protein